MLQIHLRGRKVGAYLLTKGPKTDQLCFVFGFACRGIHSTLRQEQIDPIFSNIESGLKDIPPGERLTLHLSSFADDSERQAQMRRLIEQAPSSDCKFLLLGEQARTEELTRLGVRKVKALRLYVTYTVDEAGAAGAQDAAEKLLARVESWWGQFKSGGDAMQRSRIENTITKAFTDGFQLWEQILSNKMGLEVQPLSEEQLWAGLWKRFNSTPAPPIPQLVVLNDQGLTEHVRSQVHAATLLMERSVPVADRQWVRVNGKHIGVLTFLDKPGGWVSKSAQLRYLWELLSRDTVVDTEIFCQLSRANEALVKTAMQRVLKQSNVTAAMAADKLSIDVNAQLKTKKSVEAQEKLYEGAIPLYTGIAICIHRSTAEDLNEACRYVTSCFRRPAWVVREVEYAWRIWLQTLPVVWETLLATPFQRRQLYLTSEAPGLMPLVMTRPGSRDGFELIADEGGSPVLLDLFTQHRNLGLFATTRGGKSVLVSGFLTHALSRGMPVVALDYPKPDGTSTFTDFTYFMGRNGAYFDISKESNNLFEMPDLRNISEEEQVERQQDYQGFLESALLTMIFGSKTTDASIGQLLTQTVRSILTLALTAFFADLGIQRRYHAALEGGLGSEAWAKTPTLADFVIFCSPDHLDLEGVQGTNIREAFQQIQLRLRFWLDSRVGRSISAPSSFRTDAPLLVFALRNLSNEEDAAVLALSAYSAALRRALSSPASIFFIDESPILFEFGEISSLVGRLCANGAKAGVRVILSAQDPDTIAKSPAASKIFQNLSARLIGRIQPTAIDSFQRILQYERPIIARNASDSFFPKRESIYSQWLLDDNGTFTYCRYYPAYVQLAVVANNPDEQSARQEVLRRFPDKFKGMIAFTNQYIASLRQGQ